MLQVLRAPVGGLFRHVSDLTTELSARGHQVGVVADSLTSDALTDERLDALRDVCALGVHRQPMPRTLGGADFLTPLRIRRLAQKLEVDVLHGHGAKGGLNARVGRAGRPRRVAVMTPHGGVLHHRNSVYDTIERRLGASTDAYVFESTFARRTFEDRIEVPACPHPVIPNGLRTEEFEPVEPDADARDFVFIGELVKVKGVTTLLDALAGVVAPGGRPATLALAGGGADAAAIRSQVVHLGLETRVDLLGVQRARPTFARGRCVVVPSFAESLPYVVLEAAAAGRPVVATDVGGIPEIFGPTAGRLVAAGDTAALRTALQAYLDDPAAEHTAAATRLEHVRATYSVQRMTNDIEALYREVLATRLRT